MTTRLNAYVQVCGYLAFLGLLTQSAQGVMNCKQLMYVWRWVQRDWKKAAINVGICQWWRRRNSSKLQLRRNLLR